MPTIEELESRKAELEAARAARASTEKAEALAQEVADLEMLDKLEAEHGAVGKFLYQVPTPGGMVVVKRPNALHYKRFAEIGEKAKTEDVAKLVRPCVVHPTIADFDLLCEEFPATLMRAANAVGFLAGHRQKDLSEKS